jgi:GDPmannose 4,6-dehydratase
MNKKSALITGITGQDGSILAELLLSREYKVYGVRRRSSSHSLGNAAHLESKLDMEIVDADVLDMSSILRVQKSARPDIFINCAAQSHVGVSFDQPINTAMVTGIGTMNCLESIRISGYHTKFLQISTSEMFGGLENATDTGITEDTVFHPRSPYATAKCFAHWTTVNYRESYKMYAATAICFNHEEPGRRGPNFVTRKITLGIADILTGRADKLYLGNLDAERDWGYARDYCEGMLSVLDQPDPQDFLFATGECHSVREFCEIAFKHAGLGSYKDYVEIDPMFYRPNDVQALIGDSSRARKILHWKPSITFDTMVKRMVNHDLKRHIEEDRKTDPHKYAESNLA